MEDNPLISDKTTHTVRLKREEFIHMRDYIRSKPNQYIECLRKRGFEKDPSKMMFTIINNPNTTREFFMENKAHYHNPESMLKMLDFIDNPPAGIINYPMHSLADAGQNEDMYLPLDEVEAKILNNLDNPEVIWPLSHNINLTADFVIKYIPNKFWDLYYIGANVAFDRHDIDKICQHTISLIMSGKYKTHLSPAHDAYFTERDFENGFSANPHFTVSDNGYRFYELLLNRFLWDRNYFKRCFAVDVKQRRDNLSDHLKYCFPNVVLRGIERYVNYC